MMEIHGRLQAGRFPNAPALARELEVSEKTVRRDLEYMRDSLGLPVEYDGARRGFYYSGTVESFPLVKISEGELLGLLVARQAAEAFRGTPFAGTIEGALKKLAAGLTDEVSVRAEDLGAAISFRNKGATRMDADFLRTSAVAAQAVLAREELEFLYIKPLAREAARRRVQPYHLACLHGLWYLVGWDLAREGWRMFGVTRMREARATGKGFGRKSDFSPEKFFGGSFGLWKSGRETRVRVHFDAYTSALARERFWHESQEIFEQKDGTLEMELTVGGLDEAAAWVLGFAGGARAVRPAGFVEAVRAAAKRVAEAHE
ncbi:hypothetical protein AW736_24800 [Termitidicoccus mucosus]|uniref:HTH deoR-type domain-containing protein n=2 Tax=Termitidicoccus mucosus TaxID=1184151 RepID=A0A178IB27_9BACT|nr:hypothetical protein AW736_24800 [Opitutaceae bacterium TSB47]